jgi:hypothetical protein
VDASTSWGLGIVIGRRWYSFKLIANWKQPGRDICWLEAIAIELLYHFLIRKNILSEVTPNLPQFGSPIPKKGQDGPRWSNSTQIPAILAKFSCDLRIPYN